MTQEEFDDWIKTAFHDIPFSYAGSKKPGAIALENSRVNLF